MLARLAAALLAVVLLLTTGMAGATSYLCRMDGQMHSKCCCKKSEGERDAKLAKVKPERRCCELRVLDSAPAPAAKPEGSLNDAYQVPFVTLASELVEPSHPSAQAVVLPVSARGPPIRGGPALFVLNCAYLI